jgi:methyltransferase family protein
MKRFEKLEASKRVPSSFRDPSGFLFRDGSGTLLRQVNERYRSDYRLLMESGLYRDLVDNRLLVDHEEVDPSAKLSSEACCVIRPRELPFISQPHEWAFSAFKHAALLTLEIQRRALGFGMSLKDATAFNVQFDRGQPIFIDTLSFEKHVEGRPWGAYGQFCRHFLAPLALMAKTDVDLGRLLLIHVDGVPLSLAVKLLPMRTLLSPGLLMHLHLHAWMVKRHSAGATASKGAQGSRRVATSKTGLLALVESLKRCVRRLRWSPAGTEWADYYESHSYSSQSMERKKEIVASYLAQLTPGTVWDLGANTGLFSRLASRSGARTVAFDVDPACVERNYLDVRKEGDANLLPLRLDLANPSPHTGWGHEERPSLASRGPADVVMALALLHHLAISNNVPFDRIAEFLARLCRYLVIEFVPKSDSQAQRLLRSREDIFSGYEQEEFEAAFGRHFAILRTDPIAQSGRVLYLMQRRSLGEEGT